MVGACDTCIECVVAVVTMYRNPSLKPPRMWVNHHPRGMQTDNYRRDWQVLSETRDLWDPPLYVWREVRPLSSLHLYKHTNLVDGWKVPPDGRPFIGLSRGANYRMLKTTTDLRETWLFDRLSKYLFASRRLLITIAVDFTREMICQVKYWY